MGVEQLNKHVLGVIRTGLSDLAAAMSKSGSTDEQIMDKLKGRLEDFALVYGVTVEVLKQHIATLKTAQKPAAGRGVEVLEKEYKMNFLLKCRNLWRVLDMVRTGIKMSPEEFIAELTACYVDVVKFSAEYRNYTGIKQSNRTNWNIYHGIQITLAGIKNYFGGWGDGSPKLRDQFGTRTAPHANMELDPDKVEELIELVLTKTGHYLGGAPVPVARTTGYLKDEDELLGNGESEPEEETQQEEVTQEDNQEEIQDETQEEQEPEETKSEEITQEPPEEVVTPVKDKKHRNK